MPVSFLIKLQASGLQLYQKKSLWRRCLAVIYIIFILKWYFSKFLRTFFFTKHLWWLLLAVTFESIKLFTSAKYYESIFWIILSSFNFLIQPAVFEKCQLSGSNHQRCSIKTGVLRNFTKFTVKQLCQSLFFNICLRPATLWKKRFWQIFSCEFYEISKNTFFTEHPWWLLLQKEKR